MSNIAITGSEGFVGSLLRKMLVLPDSQCFDTTIGHDITNPHIIEQICQRANTVIHLGAVSGVVNCEGREPYARLVNTEATINLAERMRDIPGMKRLIFASSASVYGEAEQYIMDEKHPCNPRTVYGLSKLAAERIMQFASRDFHIITLRPSNIYGYGTMWKENTVLNAFIKKYLSNEPIEISGNGSQKRDFVHILDICRLYKLLATTGNLRSGVFNVGGDETLSMRALAEMVNDIGEAILGYRVPVTFKPSAQDSLYHDFIYSSASAKQAFQYSPIFRVSDFIKERFMMHLRK